MEEQIECIGGPLDGNIKTFVGQQVYVPVIGLAEHIFKPGEKMIRDTMGLRGWDMYKHKEGKYHYIGIQQGNPDE
ncbi:hypothetical protein [Gimesia aquarii]|uniref:Uncharacterized protein n=1 Tax=Gimesia aquarii TaxID=2527964 RepID=A0A517VRK5_9PLAN|nr:hypothetical protein [Gimesia aquarii]QDT95648.1 hypothetical protein V144x_10940 [Gimesia aquarii]